MLGGHKWKAVGGSIAGSWFPNPSQIHVRSERNLKPPFHVSATGRLNVLGLDACKRGQGSVPPAARRSRRRPAPITIHPPIRCCSPRSGLRVRPAPHLVARTSAARLCATLDSERAWPRLPAGARPPGFGTRVRVRQQGCKTIHRRRNSTLDPHHRHHHNQARV
jgi:hypothetical protein